MRINYTTENEQTLPSVNAKMGLEMIMKADDRK